MKFERKIKLRAYLMAAYVIIGAGMWFVAFFGENVNDLLSAVGIGLMAAGAMQLGRNIHLLRNPEKLHDREIAEKDERNIALMEKARSLSFAVYITLAAIAVIVLYVFNFDLAGEVVAFSICAFCLIYWICYMIIKRKY